MQYILTEEVLISQEPSTTFINNPIQAVIDNADLLTKVQQHLLRGGKISAEIINLVLPTKFTLSSNYLLIEVENWTFKEISYINSKPFYIMGFVNTSIIKDFTTIQKDDGFTSIYFGQETDPGIPVPVSITDVFDIKNFTLALRDAVTFKLIQFTPGKYPMYHLRFTFY